jgi:hypothetical protein
MATAEETCAFFDVDLKAGLDDKSVLARLKKFGNNSDPTLLPVMLTVYKVMAKRQGKNVLVNLEHVVPGDIIFLSEGKRVPADIRLISVDNLRIDQSNLTGESLPAAKNTFALTNQTSLDRQKCMAYAGSFVTNGTGWGVVVAYGKETVQYGMLKPTKNKTRFTDLALRRLKKFNITPQNPKVAKIFKNIDTVIIDVELPDADILRVIRKIQLPLDLPCKFVVPEATADRLKKEFIGAVIYRGKEMPKHVPKQILGMIHDAQFIASPTQADMLKIVSTLEQHQVKVLWIGDGIAPNLAMRAASISMVVGDLARDDVLAQADLVAYGNRLKMLERILELTSKLS